MFTDSRIEPDPEQRFFKRATNYAKYRPRYPDAILDFMKQELHLTRKSIIADVGSGTGILSMIFLRNGNLVFGIEPNKEMREAAEFLLRPYPNFRSTDGYAENTTLPPHSVDFVTAAQSFHWFDRARTRMEFLRILKPRSWVLLIWNTRRKSTPFMLAYEKLVHDHARNAQRIGRESLGESTLADFLGRYRVRTFDNFQLLDYESLLGRLLSSSYTPLPDEPGHGPMLAGLRRIFDTYQSNGHVRLEYDTELYCSQLG